MASQAAWLNRRDVNAHGSDLEAAANLLKISQCARMYSPEDDVKRAAITLTEMRLKRRLSSLDDWSTRQHPILPLPSRAKESNSVPGPSNSNILVLLVDSNKKTKPDASSQAPPRKRARTTVEKSDRVTRSRSKGSKMRSEHLGDSLDPSGTVVYQSSASATSAEESDIKVMDNVESAERTAVNYAEKRDVEPLCSTISRPAYRIIMPSFRKRESPQD